MALSVSNITSLGQVVFATGTTFSGTTVGGLSGITYDAQNNRYFSISDDRSQVNPARFYTLNVNVGSGTLTGVTFTGVTSLLRPDSTIFPASSLDPEGIGLTNNNTVFISSEGQVSGSIASVQNPFVNEFNLTTGQQIRALPVPTKFNPAIVDTNTNGNIDPGEQTAGVRNNLAFEIVTLTPDKKFLFTATENALVQDGLATSATIGSPSRIIKYNLTTGLPEQEFVYITDPVAIAPNPPANFNTNGLVEMLALDSKGKFLALERSFTAGAPGTGNTIKLFEVDASNATDVSGINDVDANNDNIVDAGIVGVQKTLLLNFDSLNLAGGSSLGLPAGLDNVEGMTFGPKLPNGQQSLILVSDNNFSATQFTQFIGLGLTIASETPASSIGVTNIPSGSGFLRLGANLNDTISGGTSNDTIYGYAGNDLIFGLTNPDYLDGGIGNDTLVGGNGNDTLVGGAGNDTLRYDLPSEGGDTVAGFTSGSDKFSISDFGFAGGLAGSLAGTPLTAAQFGLGTSATTAAQRFIYDTATGILRFDPDGSGALSSSIIATLTGSPTLVNTDITVF